MASSRPLARARERQRPHYSGLFRIQHLYPLSVLVLVVAVLAVWGVLAKCVGDQCQEETIWQKLPKLVNILPGFSQRGQTGGTGFVPIQLTIAQYLLTLIVIFGALRAFAGNLRRDIRVWLARLRRHHVIICGLNETGREIAENLLFQYRSGHRHIVAIALDNDEPNAKTLDELKVPILKGDATRFGMLTLAGLRRASGVVVTTGSDAVNIEVALRVADELAAEAKRPWPRTLARIGRALGTAEPLPVFVLPEVRSAWLLDLITQPTMTLGSYRVETRPFDLYALAARQLLSAPPFRRRLPPRVRPHLLLAGLGEMGTQIIAHAARVTYAMPGCRLAVTVLDRQGEAAGADFATRFPGLRDVVDLSFVSATFDADDLAARQQLWESVEAALRNEGEGLFTVAAIVSLAEDKDSLYTALELRLRLDRLGQFGTLVFARVRRQRGLAEFTVRLDRGRSLIERLVPFGDLASLTGPEQLIDQRQDRFARALHEAYLVSRGPNARPSPADVPWPLLAEPFKQSNRSVADHLPTKLRLVGMRSVPGRGESAEFTRDELETMAIAEHERWWIERKVVGWVQGPRDDVRRIHPDMRPWCDLTDPQREYDRVMVRALRANLARVGQVIRRERLIAAFGDGLPSAEAALAAIRSDEVAIVVFDPSEPASWEFARRAAPSAVLWVLWPEDCRGPPAAPSEVPRVVQEAIEAVVSPGELAGLMS